MEYGTVREALSLVILPDQAFAVAGQVFGDDGHTRGRVLGNQAGGVHSPGSLLRAPLRPARRCCHSRRRSRVHAGHIDIVAWDNKCS